MCVCLCVCLVREVPLPPCHVRAPLPRAGVHAYHETRRGTAVVNFATGALSAVGPGLLKIVHAALMILSWGILLPAGVFAARCCRHRPDSCWFKFHRAFQVYVCVCVCVCV